MDADQTIDRIHDRAADLIVALTARDTAAAYQAARQLRTACDVLVGDLLPEYMALPATDELLLILREQGARAQQALSEVLHD